MFPLDSLRIYLNKTQNDSLFTGIDFRTHQQSGDTTFIELGSFSRLDTLNKDYSHFDTFLISRNSNFGHKILFYNEIDHILFKNKNGSIDTLQFQSNADIAQEWTVFEDQKLLIEAKILNIAFNGIDSTKTFRLTTTNKKSNQKKIFKMVIGKQFGLMQSPVFYELWKYPEDLTLHETVEFKSYKELTEYEFMLPKLGTVLDWNYRYVIRNTLYQGQGRDSFIGISNGKMAFKTDLYSSQISSTGKIEHVVNDSMVYRALGDSTLIFNPIHSQKTKANIGLEIGLLSPFIGQFYCDRLVLVPSFSFGATIYEQIGDTIFTYPRVGDIEPFWNQWYMEGVGMIYNQVSYTNFYKSWSFIKIPQSCEVGSRMWLFTSTARLSNPAFQIFPNPANQSFSISSNEEIDYVELLDIKGDVHKLPVDNGRYFVGHLSNGIYTVLGRIKATPKGILYLGRIVIN